jgi:hypothetical protein
MPGCRENGGARHSVRAVVVNQNAIVGKARRAEDCPPYLCRCVNLNVICHKTRKSVDSAAICRRPGIPGFALRIPRS